MINLVIAIIFALCAVVVRLNPKLINVLSEEDCKRQTDLSGVVFVAGLGSLLTMGLPQKKRQSDCSVVSFAKVIPAVEAMRVICFKHSKRCAIFVVFTHTTLTL